MDFNVIDKLLTNGNARPQLKLKCVRAIVMHWTANTGKGANAIANRNFFNRETTKASAHYIVDSKNIIRCIPDDEVAYHVGAKQYTAFGESIKAAGKSPNFSTIGIEMCVNSDDDFAVMKYISRALAAKLLLVNHLTIDDLVRHYDITGKNCPQFLLEEKDWEEFKELVLDILKKSSAYKERKYGIVNTESSGLNVRTSPDTITSTVLFKIPKGHKVEIVEEKGEWVRIGYGWVSARYIKVIHEPEVIEHTRELKIGGIYRHFKGGLYKVLCTALHTETQETLVIYQSQETNKIFARPYDMFMSEVDRVKYPNAPQKYRLELVE